MKHGDSKILKLFDDSLCLIPSKTQYFLCIAKGYALLRLELQAPYVKTTDLRHHGSRCYEFEQIVALNGSLPPQLSCSCCGCVFSNKIIKILPQVCKSLEEHGFVGRCVE